jgi:release factor glutamine methyltransferase
MPDGTRVAALLAASALPPREARALLAAAMGTSREHLVAHPDAAVAQFAAARFGEFARRRAQGTPLAYLLGEQEFYGRAFTVTPDVLVPRPDTETLVEAALECLTGRTAPRVLELGTGSGCIAVTLACERPDAQIVATDVSPAALDVARGNAARHGARIELRRGDWLGAVEPGEVFDLVVANPPYVAAGDPHLAALRDEPTLALTDGADGLRCLATIAAAAPARLVPGGWLALEHGHDQGPAVARLLAAAGLQAVTTTRDAVGHPRVTRGRRA